MGDRARAAVRAARRTVGEVGGQLGLDAEIRRPFQYGTGTSFYRRLGFLERSQWWSAVQPLGVAAV